MAIVKYYDVVFLVWLGPLGSSGRADLLNLGFWGAFSKGQKLVNFEGWGGLNLEVMEGGCLRRGWLVFPSGNHENHEIKF